MARWMIIFLYKQGVFYLQVSDSECNMNMNKRLCQHDLVALSNLGASWSAMGCGSSVVRLGGEGLSQRLPHHSE